MVDMNKLLQRIYNSASIDPLDEARSLIIRLRFLKRTYNITECNIYDIRWYLDQLEREFMSKKPTMNADIKEFDIFLLTPSGKLKQTFNILSTADYNHYQFNLHHYIPKQQYEKNKSWYEERGIKQKLILVPITLHEQIHNQAVTSLSDDDFYGFYKISRWELIFNRKHSKY